MNMKTAKKTSKKTAAKKAPTKKAPTKKASKELSIKDAPFVILRGYKSGVHAGYLVDRNFDEHFVLANARRIWRFNGAETLSEVAVYGFNSDSRIAPLVQRQEVAREDVSEIIHCQPAGKRAIEEAPEWRGTTT